MFRSILEFLGLSNSTRLEELYQEIEDYKRDLELLDIKTRELVTKYKDLEAQSSFVSNRLYNAEELLKEVLNSKIPSKDLKTKIYDFVNMKNSYK